LNVPAAVAAIEFGLIEERTVSGIRATRAKDKTLGRPLKVFRRDQVVKLRRDEDGLSWRQTGDRLNVPAMTAYNAYQTFRKENVPETDAANTGKIGQSRAAVRP